MKRAVRVVIVIAVVSIALTIWAFLVVENQAEKDTPIKLELKRTINDYGDMPFESDKLQEIDYLIEAKERAATVTERIFLLEDGKWIEEKILEHAEDKYRQTQEGLKDLSESNVDTWRWREMEYIYHIDAYKQDIIRDRHDKLEYIEELQEFEKLVRMSTLTTEYLKNDKRINEIREKFKEVQKLREQ